jgi:hypothetical protein
MAAITLIGQFLAAMRATLSSISTVIKSTQFNRSMFIAGLGAYTSFAVLLFAGFFVVTLFKEVTGIGMSPIDRVRHRRRRRSIIDNVDYKALVLGGGAIGSGLLQAIYGTTMSFLLMQAATILTWLSPIFIVILGSLFMSYSSAILGSVLLIYQGLIVPLNSLLMSAVTLIAMTAYIIYPIVVGIIKFIAVLPYRIIQVVMVCVFDVLYTIIQLSVTAVYSFTTALVFWIFSGPLTTEFPFFEFFSALAQAMTVIGSTVVECMCSILRYVTGGLTRAFTNPSFPAMLTNALNFVWITLSFVLIQPVLSLFTIPGGGSFQWPNFDDSFRLWIGT